MRLRGSAPARRTIATVLFTDIVASTEHATGLGDAAYRQLLRSHHRIVRQLLRQHRGREIDTAGDGFLAVFAQPADAIAAALAIADDVERLGIQIRAGLHVGEVEADGGKVVGITVHIGSRVLAQAEPGQLVATSTVRELAAGAGYEFTDLGPRSLKGVAEPWRLYAVGRRAAAAETAPDATEDASARTRFFLVGGGAAAATILLLAAAFVLSDEIPGDVGGSLSPNGPSGSEGALIPGSSIMPYELPAEDQFAVVRAEDDNGPWEIYLITRPGSVHDAQLTDDPQCHSPSWSADGERLAFVCEEPTEFNSVLNAREAFVMDVGPGIAERRGLTQFGEGLAGASDVAWMADGRVVVASSRHVLAGFPCPDCGLTLLGPATRQTHLEVGSVVSVSVSSTTNDIFYVGDEIPAKHPSLFWLRVPDDPYSDEQIGDAERIDLPGTNLVPTSVAVSPDGTRLALSMQRQQGSESDIYLYHLGSGELIAVLTGSAHDYDASWAGNDRLVFTRTRRLSFQIWLVGLADDSTPEPLTAGPAHYTFAAWRPLQ